MTFLRADRLRPAVGGIAVGGHLLEVHHCPWSLDWQLRCGGCLAALAGGVLDLTGPLLAGAQALPATGGHPAVSWAWGALPVGSAGPVEVVFGRGLRRPVLVPAHLLPGGGWAAAGPGRARHAIAVAVDRAISDERRVDRLIVPACAGVIGESV